MYLHRGPVCKEGCISTCSKGESCPEGSYGGWRCNGCLYDTLADYVAANGEDNSHLDVEKIREAIQEVNNNKKFTRYQVIDYIMGWSLHDQHMFSVEDIKSMLNNTLSMLEDNQDGIKATFERRDQND